ncbi:MAG TPA: type II toxin-antitoxin system VapC family toxin [Pseudonocardia sp.]|nr:type II toxin-antitoxin system VapC family toxin [Pseudonocardia sp.]
MIVLDTTVLLYAVGTGHPLREPCRRLLGAPAASGLTTTAGVLQEFVHVREHRRPRSDAVELGRSYLTLLRPLLEVPEPAVERALSLLDDHAELGAFDAVLAAAAAHAGCRAVVTADRAFARIEGLPVTFPDEPGVAALLGGDR